MAAQMPFTFAARQQVIWFPVRPLLQWSPSPAPPTLIATSSGIAIRVQRAPRNNFENLRILMCNLRWNINALSRCRHFQFQLVLFTSIASFLGGIFLSTEGRNIIYVFVLQIPFCLLLFTSYCLWNRKYGIEWIFFKFCCFFLNIFGHWNMYIYERQVLICVLIKGLSIGYHFIIAHNGFCSW